MVYDADQAGEMATLRGLDLFLEEGMNVKVATLDKGHDPDSFIRKFGPRGFNETVKKAKSLFTYKLDILNEKWNATEAEGKAEIVKEMLLTIQRVRNAVIKAEYIKKLSQELFIKEEAVWEELKKIKRKTPRVKEPGFSPDLPARAGDLRQDEKKKIKIDISPAEKILARLMLEDMKVVNAVKDNLTPFDFKNPDIRNLVETLFSMDAGGTFVDAGRLINYLEDKVAPHVISFIVNEDMEIKDKDRNVSDCIKTIKREERDRTLKDIQNRLLIAQKNGYEDEAKSLLAEFNRLIKRGV
jgi:DNA primase